MWVMAGLFLVGHCGSGVQGQLVALVPVKARSTASAKSAIEVNFKVVGRFRGAAAGWPPTRGGHDAG